MDRWLIIYSILTVCTLIWCWAKDKYYQIKKQKDKEYLNNKLKEWDWLYDNTEINEALHEINTWEITVPEPAQPVSEPTTADILIKEATEWKN